MPARRLKRQGGFGLIEVLVASALLGVALVVLLGSLSTLLIGSRTAQYRTVAERLARNTIEDLMAQPLNTIEDLTAQLGGCLPDDAVTVEGARYELHRCWTPINPGPPGQRPKLVEYQVVVSDRSGGSVALRVRRAAVPEPPQGDEE